MATKPKIPDIPQAEASDRTQLQRFIEAVREVIQTREGLRGNALDRAVTFRDLVDLSLADVRPGGSFYSTGGPAGPAGPAGPQGPPGEEYVPDYTAPPSPANLRATSLFKGAFIEWDTPSYTVGHGNAYTEIYVAQYGGTGPLPTYASAVAVGKAAGLSTVYPHPAAMGAQLHIWARHVTQDGTPSATPAGGTNGVQVTVGRVGNADLADLIVTADKLASGAVTASKMAAQAVGLTAFANGIEPVTIVAAGPLPTVKSTETVFWGGALYRWDGAAYTPRVLGANAVTATEIAANAVTAGKIAAAAVSATQLAAGAVTADKILVTGRGAALNDDPNTQDISAWTFAGTAGAIVAAPGSTAGATALQIPAASVTNSRHFPINDARVYRLRVSARALTASVGRTLGLTLEFLNDSLAAVGSQVFLSSLAVPTSWTEYISGELPPPTGAVFARIRFLGSTVTHEVQDIRCEEFIGADLIVNGAIIAGKIAAGAIAVGSAAIANGAIRNALIENLAVDSAKIADLAVGTAKLADAAITTAKIGDAQITNAKIVSLDATKITTGFLDAARIAAGSIDAAKINANGLTVRDTFGNIILNADGLRNAVYGLNLLYNGDFASGFDGWLSGGFGLTVIGSGFNAGSFAIAPATARGNTVAYLVTGPNTGTALANVERYTTPTACKEGDRMCVSAYVGSQRADSEIILYWTDVNGNPFASSPAGSAVSRCTAGEALGGSLLSQYKRIYNIGVAPAGTYGCALSIRKYDTVAGQPDSYVFWTKCQIEPLAPLANAPGPWMPPAYTSRITAANASTFIESAAINYLSLAGGATSVSNVMNFSGTNANDGFMGQMQVSIPANGHLYITGYYRCLPDATFFSATTKFSFAANVRVAILKNGTQIATKTFFNNIVNGPWVSYMQASGSAVGTDAAAIGWGIAITATAGDVFTVQAYATTFQFAPAGGSSYIGQIFEGVLHVSGLYR